MSVNKVILLGNVGKDPEVRYLDTGIAVATFPLATTDRAHKCPKEQNGTILCCGVDWQKRQRNMFTKVISFILKEK